MWVERESYFWVTEWIIEAKLRWMFCCFVCDLQISIILLVEIEIKIKDFWRYGSINSHVKCAMFTSHWYLNSTTIADSIATERRGLCFPMWYGWNRDILLGGEWVSHFLIWGHCCSAAAELVHLYNTVRWNRKWLIIFFLVGRKRRKLLVSFLNASILPVWYPVNWLINWMYICCTVL